MKPPRASGLWLGLLALAVLALAAQNPPEPAKLWQDHLEAGNTALLAGRLAEAETRYRAALNVAEKFELDESRLALSLFVLGGLYQAQGRAAEAAPLLERLRALREKAAEEERHHQPAPNPLDAAEMGTRAEDALALSRLLERAETLQKFATDYFSAGWQTRPVFEKYLDTLEPGAMLDFLETVNPYCHEEAHELGQALFARHRAIGPALGACQARCGTGCMHGVLKEAFGGAAPAAPPAELKKQMAGLCFEGEMAEMYQPGNCAHGIGHALLALAGRDLGEALAACASFGNPAREYYCATGIFMEYEMEPVDENVPAPSLHYPCDTYTRYPAACYRYHAFALWPALGEDRARFVAECRSLPEPRRRGCFHGLGAVHMRAISTDPPLLAEVCQQSSPAEQAVCIEGAIEFLADYNQPKAIAACAALQGENAAVCDRAAREKRYRLDKPTMKLYTGEPPRQP
jgi:tetratricopeptide (TPR) repeat protein